MYLTVFLIPPTIFTFIILKNFIWTETVTNFLPSGNVTLHSGLWQYQINLLTLLSYSHIYGEPNVSIYPIQPLNAHWTKYYPYLKKKFLSLRKPAHYEIPEHIRSLKSTSQCLFLVPLVNSYLFQEFGLFSLNDKWS